MVIAQGMLLVVTGSVIGVAASLGPNSIPDQFPLRGRRAGSGGVHRRPSCVGRGGLRRYLAARPPGEPGGPYFKPCAANKWLAGPPLPGDHLTFRPPIRLASPAPPAVWCLKSYHPLWGLFVFTSHIFGGFSGMLLTSLSAFFRRAFPVLLISSGACCRIGSLAGERGRVKTARPASGDLSGRH